MPRITNDPLEFTCGRCKVPIRLSKEEQKKLIDGVPFCVDCAALIEQEYR